MTDSSTLKRLVVKIGSGVVTQGDPSQLEVDRNSIFQLAGQISRVVSRGIDVVIVSSGAVALGMEELEIRGRPSQMSEVQALAATGQGLLMQLWRDAFERHRLRVGQILLTHSDLADRRRFLNVRATLDALLAYGVVPIVNENDTVMTDEITVGDNDHLAAQVAKLVGGDLLLLLTTVDGLLDGQGNVVAYVGLTDKPKILVDDNSPGVGRGGMTTKIEAAQAAGRGGIAAVVANGKRRDVVLHAVDGANVGTRFEHDKKGLPSRKHWIAYTLKSQGELTIDAGAAKALTTGGASLLPIGIVGCTGAFGEGDLVLILDSEGNEVARGLARLSAEKISTGMGKKGPLAVHRDDLVTW